VKNNIIKLNNGSIILGDVFDLNLGLFPLIIADPPYGKIIDEEWDDKWTYEDYLLLGFKIKSLLEEGGSAFVWGGIGKQGNRQFFKFLATVEEETGLKIQNVITWSKKRAYGKKDDYLFTREEVVWLVNGDKPKTFNIPLLDEKRGYAGYASKQKVGYITLCYGIHEKISHDSNMSPSSQAQGKRDVQFLLRQMELLSAQGKKNGNTQSLGAEKQAASRRVQKVLFRIEKGEISFTGSVQLNQAKLQEKGNSFRFNLGGFGKGLDDDLSCSWNSDKAELSAPGRLNIGGQDKQLDWVRTREHLCDVLEGKSLKTECNNSRVGSGFEFYEIQITESVVKYPAKSEFKRRTNVWTDITEVLRGKIHECEKPERLAEVIIETHSRPGEDVLDLFSGSGNVSVVAERLGRRYVAVEKHRKTFDSIVNRLVAA